MLEKRNRKIILASILVAMIIIVPISFYGLGSKPVPITANNSSSSYVVKGAFTRIKNALNPLRLNETKAITSISTANFQNSSLSIAVTGYVWTTEAQGACFDFWLTVCGNLTSNLHPTALVLSQSISYFSVENTSKLPRTSAYSNWYTQNQGSRVNMTNLSRPASENNLCCISLLKKGTVSYILDFSNDTHLSKSSMYHFALTNQSRSSWSYPFIENTFCFYPGSYNMTYYTNFTASITGLSKPVSAQVDLTLVND